MHNPESNMPYDAQNLCQLIDNFFDALAPDALQNPSRNREHEQAVTLERHKVFLIDRLNNHLSSGQAFLTRPIPEEINTAKEAWPEFGGHRVTFYKLYDDGSGTTTHYSAQGAEVLKEKFTSRPSGLGRESQKNLDELDALRDTVNVDVNAIARSGLMREIDGDRMNQTVVVGQDELENLLSWVGGAAPLSDLCIE